MSDADLIGRLRVGHATNTTQREAADRIEALTGEVEGWRANLRANYEAFTAMRNDLNEVVGNMVSQESTLQYGPEMAHECEAVVAAVRGYAFRSECVIAESARSIHKLMTRALTVERALAEALGHIAILANDMSDVVEAQYVDLKDYPSEARRYERDIAPVRAARDFITAQGKEKGS